MSVIPFNCVPVPVPLVPSSSTRARDTSDVSRKGSEAEGRSQLCNLTFKVKAELQINPPTYPISSGGRHYFIS